MVFCVDPDLVALSMGHITTLEARQRNTLTTNGKYSGYRANSFKKAQSHRLWVWPSQKNMDEGACNEKYFTNISLELVVREYPERRRQKRTPSILDTHLFGKGNGARGVMKGLVSMSGVREPGLLEFLIGACCDRLGPPSTGSETRGISGN